MDIDIAINDIKKLREGFISYVNDQGEQEEGEVDQIDDFLDPQKFIERHFGEENPDIIFQEVITSVPDPPPPRINSISDDIDQIDGIKLTDQVDAGE